MFRLFRKFVFLARYIFKIKLRPGVNSDSLVTIYSGVRIICEKNAEIVFGKNVVLKSGTIIYAKRGSKIRIGSFTSTGMNTEISCGGLIDIGDDVIMGAYTYITDSNHAYSDNSIPIRLQSMDIGITKIGANVWLGRQSMVLKGAEIGERVIVAAGAVVTNVCQPNSIVGGIPAKEIKKI